MCMIIKQTSSLLNETSLLNNYMCLYFPAHRWRSRDVTSSQTWRKSQTPDLTTVYITPFDSFDHMHLTVMQIHENSILRFLMSTFKTFFFANKSYIEHLGNKPICKKVSNMSLSKCMCCEMLLRLLFCWIIRVFNYLLKVQWHVSTSIW